VRIDWVKWSGRWEVEGATRLGRERDGMKPPRKTSEKNTRRQERWRPTDRQGEIERERERERRRKKEENRKRRREREREL